MKKTASVLCLALLSFGVCFAGDLDGTYKAKSNKVNLSPNSESGSVVSEILNLFASLVSPEGTYTSAEFTIEGIEAIKIEDNTLTFCSNGKETALEIARVDKETKTIRIKDGEGEICDIRYKEKGEEISIEFLGLEFERQ